MKILSIDEPLLEFAGGEQHVDIRAGVAAWGPFDLNARVGLDRIHIGIIGSAKSVERACEWFERARSIVAAKESNQPNLFPSFAGCNEDCTFRSRLEWSNASLRRCPERELNELAGIDEYDEFVARSASYIVDQVEGVLSSAPTTKVIIIALPVSIAARSLTRSDLGGKSNRKWTLDLHDLIKAQTMRFGVPTQLVLPSTFDTDVKIPRQKGDRERSLQDEATRAWNLHTAIYYKAGGVPWRIAQDRHAISTCYVGMSFYYNLSKDIAYGSVAQVFDTRGDGFVIRGGPATKSTRDRQLHLNAENAYDLMASALKAYRQEHLHPPARVVVHKTTSFSREETEGCKAALGDASIAISEFIHIGETPIRLFREDRYPPLRGTVLQVDDRNLVVYTIGSVTYFGTYPGMYIPTPIVMHLEETESPPAALAQELLALSKMNWNKTQFDGRDPMTLKAAKSLGRIFKYMPEGAPIESRYRFYM